MVLDGVHTRAGGPHSCKASSSCSLLFGCFFTLIMTVLPWVCLRKLPSLPSLHRKAKSRRGLTHTSDGRTGRGWIHMAGFSITVSVLSLKNSCDVLESFVWSLQITSYSLCFLNEITYMCGLSCQLDTNLEWGDISEKMFC